MGNIVNNCDERSFAIINTISVIPLSECTFSRPVYTDIDKLTSADYSFAENPVVLSRTAETPKVSTQKEGLVYSVSVSAQVKYNTTEEHDLAIRLAHEPHVVVIDFFGGTRAIVRTSPEGYGFKKVEQDGSVTFDFDLTNGQGLSYTV